MTRPSLDYKLLKAANNSLELVVVALVWIKLHCRWRTSVNSESHRRSKANR
jgi:hypothetical protein